MPENEKTMPKKNSVQFTWSPSEPGGALRKKLDAAGEFLNTINGTKPSKPSFGTNMRDFAVGSQERADEYTKRGWAQDATTKVSQQNKPVVTPPASSASSTATDFKKIGAISTALGGNTDYDAGLGFETQNPFRIAAKTAKATPATETAPTLSKKEARQEKRAKRLEGRIADQTAKGKTAVSEGRFIDAGNKQGRVQNLQKRVDRLRK
jgi:hypothetical protein